LPVFGLHPHQQTIPGDAGVVDQNIQATAALQNAFDQTVNLRFHGDVGLQCVGLSACCSDLGDHLFGRCSGVGVIHHHFCTRFGQGDGDGAPNAATPSSDQCGLTVE